MKFTIVSSLVAFSSLAAAATVDLFPATTCAGGATLSCRDINIPGGVGLCCWVPSQVYASARLTGSQGSLYVTGNVRCEGPRSGTVGLNTCLSPSFAFQSAFVNGPASLLAKGKPVSMAVNSVTYTNKQGVERIARIPVDKAAEVSDAVVAGNLDVLDALADF